MGRTLSQTSVSGRLRALLNSGPVDTAAAAKLFGKPSAVMSALLNQLRQRGEAVQLRRGSAGRGGKPAFWGAPSDL